MKSEREMFEEWYSSAYSETIHMLPNGQYSSLRCQHSWDAWTASASREDYKIVPVEPTEEMLDAARRRQWDDLSSPLEDMDTLKYKAMIGAADE